VLASLRFGLSLFFAPAPLFRFPEVAEAFVRAGGGFAFGFACLDRAWRFGILLPPFAARSAISASA